MISSAETCSAGSFSQGSFSEPNPVAITVTLIVSPIESSVTTPGFKSNAGLADAHTIFEISVSSFSVKSLLAHTLIRKCFAPSIRVSSSRGLFIAFVAASTARFSPLAVPIPKMAVP